MAARSSAYFATAARVVSISCTADCSCAPDTPVAGAAAWLWAVAAVALGADHCADAAQPETSPDSTTSPSDPIRRPRRTQIPNGREVYAAPIRPTTTSAMPTPRRTWPGLDSVK